MSCSNVRWVVRCPARSPPRVPGSRPRPASSEARTRFRPARCRPPPRPAAAGPAQRLGGSPMPKMTRPMAAAPAGTPAPAGSAMPLSAQQSIVATIQAAASQAGVPAAPAARIVNRLGQRCDVIDSRAANADQPSSDTNGVRQRDEPAGRCCHLQRQRSSRATARVRRRPRKACGPALSHDFGPGSRATCCRIANVPDDCSTGDDDERTKQHTNDHADRLMGRFARCLIQPYKAASR